MKLAVREWVLGARPVLVGVLLGAVVLFSSCVQSVTKVELTPDGDRLLRKSPAGTPKPPAGSLTYERFESDLGELFVYVEEFGEPVEELEEAFDRLKRGEEATDRLIELASGWLRMELGDEPGFDRLRRWVDEQLNRDLHYLLRQFWCPGLSVSQDRAREAAEVAGALRAGQHFVECGYFNAAEVPQIGREIAQGEEEALLRRLRRFVADRMGVREEEAIPECLDFLATADSAASSLRAYLRTTELYKEKKTELEEGEELDPLTVLEDTADALLTFDIVIFPDTLRVRLNCGKEPFSTNGDWHAQAGAVTWEISRGEDRRGAFCHALWAVAHEGAQRRLFGDRLLEDEALAEYVMWYEGLTPEEARQWEVFLADLGPDAPLAERLEAFEFEGAPGLAGTPHRLLPEALEAEPDGEPGS